MCGIIGVFGIFNQKDFANHVLNVQPQLIRRGPDIQNSLIFEDFHATHSRLVVRGDVEDGKQPFSCKHLTVLFNGNLYNKAEIQLKLEALGYEFEGLCDTEVVAVAILHWGANAYSKFNGFFAIVVHNKLDNTITMARDRCGQKPIYFSLTSKAVFFGSTEKMIPKHACGAIRQESYIDFITYGFVPAPSTMYQNMHLIEPATYVTFKFKCGRPHIQQKVRFWEPELRSEINCFEESLEALSYALGYAVSDGLIAEASIACLFSGGIDSSILFFLAKQKKYDIFAITGDFGENDNSIKRALPLITMLNHNKYLMKNISPEEVDSCLNQLNMVCESPFDDTSMIPSMTVYKTVRDKGFKVAITGDGADELFCGYQSFSNLKKMNPILNKSFDNLRKKTGAIFKNLIPKKFQNPNFERYFMNSNELLTDLSCNGFKEREWADGLKTDYDPHHYIKNIIDEYQGIDTFEKFRILNLLFKLPNQMLYKVDRASMYNSVEARPLFLDNRVVDVSLRIKSTIMMQTGQKSLLKEFCKTNLPPAGWSLPKDGFGWKTKSFYDIFKKSDEDRIFQRSKIKSHILLNNRKINIKRGYFGMHSLSSWLKEN